MSFNMKTAKPYWTFAKAMKVTEDERHCCRIRKSERLIPMLPKYIGKLKTGIKEILDMEIGKYTKWVGGVLLGYSKVRLSPTSLPLDDQPVIPYNVHMDAIIFQPMIGKTLKCTVNEVAPDHIGCLALDYFNVSIPIPKTGSKGQDGQGVKNLQPGMHLLVEIRKIRNMHGIISIHGTLQANLSGSMKSMSTPDKADSGILSGADEDIPMDTTPSDVDSVASIVMVTGPSNKMSSPPPVILSSSSSDLDTSMESLGSPKKKKKKKKRKHSFDEMDAAGVVKMESTSKADASRKKTQGKKHKNLCKEDKKEHEVPMDISEDDQTADTSVVKQELHSSASLESLTSPSPSSSSKKKKKTKGLTKDDIDQIVNAKKEISVVKQESSSPSAPNSSLAKKKKHKHSKKERPTIIKLEIPSDAEEETKDPSEKPTNSGMSSSSAKKEKKHKKKTSTPSVTVKTEHLVKTISGQNSRTVTSSAKSAKKHDKLKNLKSPVRGKDTGNKSSLPQSSTVLSSSSSDGKKAKKRKHSKERSQPEVPIKKERGDDDPKKGKPDTSADIKTMLSKSEKSQHSKKKSHGNKSKIVKLEKNQKSNNKIMKKKIKVEKKAKHKKPKVKK